MILHTLGLYKTRSSATAK